MRGSTANAVCCGAAASRLPGPTMGRSRHDHHKSENMIDTTNKQPGTGDMRGSLKSQACKEARRKHDAINLPKNLIDSDSDENVEECSSEDENEQFTQKNIVCNRTGHNISTNELSCNFSKLDIKERQNIIVDAAKKLSSYAKKYQETKVKTLKARSPYRNRLTEHKQTPFERPNMTVITQLGNGGRVFVQTTTPSSIPEPVSTFPKDNYLLDAIQDKAFLASFRELSTDEAEQVFLNFMEQDHQARNAYGTLVVPQYNQMYIMSPVTKPQPMIPPYTKYIKSPDNSPNHADLYDSSYESGSPCSTVVTSPGSPSHLLSPPRTSVSSESDQELDPAAESRPIWSKENALLVPTASVLNEGSDVCQPQSNNHLMVKCEPLVRPLGEVVHCIATSASQRLYELSKSTSFCVKHFTIQLVRVVMTTKAETTADKLDNFTKSLLGVMKAKLMNKAHEGDIWQLSIYAHIQFLMAPDRVQEYRPVLLNQDERGRSLLYMAAMERCEKHLIARYIAESLAHAGYSPQEVDENGNSIIHLVAQQGDSHVNVLSELLMAIGPDMKPLYSVLMTNMKGQSPLHLAVQSPHPHLTTVLLLLKMGAHPLDLDEYKMTPLHYHIQHVASRMPRLREDVEVIKKMLQAPMSLSKESLQVLEQLRSDASVPADLSSVILDILSSYGVKDPKSKKNEKR